jgi:hypothetical protein
MRSSPQFAKHCEAQGVNMDLQTFLRHICQSTHKEWTKIEVPSFTTYDEILSLDLDLSVSIGIKEHRSHFDEPWTKGFANPSASSSYIDLLWNGRPVHRLIGVWLDGGRAIVPIPEPSTLEVTEQNETIFRLVDSLCGTGAYDEYMRRAKIKVRDET